MKTKILFIPLVVLVLWSCSGKPRHETLRIALSSGSDNYVRWIHRLDSTVQIIDLKGLPIDSALQLLNSCHGILFTGGEDVVPAYYGQAADSSRCEMNPARDSLEFSLIRAAFKRKMPVFGICRGQQIINVAKGGTLIVDIPSDAPSTIAHRCEDYTKCFHSVKVVKETLLSEICKSDTGWVTTNHHQAVAFPGEGIRVSAHSADGLPEAIEWADNKGKSFFLAVQWHPERMQPGSALSDPLGKAFLQACIIRSVLN